jgi:3'(2'), 5'-bisphosphate nucleotidase
MTDELQTARELAIRAGAILLEHYTETPSVEWKGRGDPVTAADRSASRFLVGELKQRFPQDGVLCEEERDSPDRLSKPRVWIVDPMDGTAEFIAYRGEFAVMIGLAIEGKPTLGVVYQPTEKKLYFAVSGTGAFVEHAELARRLQVSREADPSRIVVAVSRSHDSADAKLIRGRLNVGRIIPSGSAGLKVAMICEGQAHLYFHAGPGTNQWDTCAPEIILHEAGGRMTDVFNTPLRYNVPDSRNLQGLMASNGVIHDRAIDAAKAVLHLS